MAPPVALGIFICLQVNLASSGVDELLALRHASRGYQLHLAALSGRTEELLALLAAGVHPDQLNDHGRTALHLAAYSGNTVAVRALLGLGAQLDLQDDRACLLSTWQPRQAGWG